MKDTVQLRDRLFEAVHAHTAEPGQAEGTFPGYTVPMETELETAVLRALFPDYIKPAFPHLFQPPYLLDESGGCFVTQK